MAERSYTVAEIDALRQACDNRYIWGNANGRVAQSTGSFHPAEKAAVVEEWVRTHMLAGHTADDLKAEDYIPPERIAELRRQEREMQDEIRRRFSEHAP